MSEATGTPLPHVEFLKKHGLGRLPAPDSRDHQHMLSAVTPKRADVSSKMWTPGAVLDQGNSSECVANAWTGFLEASPLRTSLVQFGGVESIHALYKAAQKVDEWPGEDYNGTSVRAGAKVLTTQGRLAEYLWAFDVDTMRRYVLSRGPVVVGTNWYEDMFYPEQHKKFLSPTGAMAGGHAWLVIGYSLARKSFRMVNSWGPSWGEKGRAWIKLDDMAKLIAESGEVCSAVEQKVVAK